MEFERNLHQENKAGNTVRIIWIDYKKMKDNWNKQVKLQQDEIKLDEEAFGWCAGNEWCCSLQKL